MANIRKWMAEARACEDRGDVQGALSVFRKALVAQEESSGFADLSLHNGLGDLYMRAGRVEDAIKAYETAATQCEEQQLFANGLALCKKILRNAPDHAPVYRRAARLFALSGLHVESQTNYREHARRAIAAGDPEEAVDALRERVDVMADDEAALELADTLSRRGQVDDALAMLRSVRVRREREGTGVVPIVRKIQELQPRLAIDDVPSVPEERALARSPEPRVPDVAASHPDMAAGRAEIAASHIEEVDAEALSRELHAVLSQVEGEDRFRQALPLVEHLIELEPDRFDLLHRKLAYAFAVGDEQAAVDAYLALGECLDRQFTSFRLRSLSTTAENGAITAAVTVERAVELAPGS
jgi:tetratricopeptide (TPR) repeat protein